MRRGVGFHHGLLGAVLLTLAGCRSAPPSRSPAADLDDIAAIESELAMNAERLEAQGVRLAFATSSPTGEADAPGGSRSYDGKDESESSEPAAPPAEPAPEPAPEPESESESEPVVAAEEDAASSDDKLDVGAARAPSPSKRKASERRTRGEQTRCERICDLAEATCTLADRICDLAAEHVDDVRYENACERATSQCEAASEACSMCEE